MSKVFNMPQIARFGSVSLSAAGIHLGIAYLMLTFITASAHVANTTGFVGASFCAWLGHYAFTFRGKGTVGRSLPRYAIVVASGFLLNIAFLSLVIASGFFGKTLSIAISLIAIPIATYLASTVWAFTRKTD